MSVRVEVRLSLDWLLAIGGIEKPPTASLAVKRQYFTFDWIRRAVRHETVVE